MEEKPAMKPLTYHEQYEYYVALCDSASQLAGSWRDYRQMIAKIRRELRADPDYKELVANKFRAPEKPVVESKPEDDADTESLEAVLGFEF